MSTAFAIAFGPPTARRYLTPAETPEQPEATGWRPFIWVKDVERAEKFGSEEAAWTWALCNLPHGDWTVVVAPSRGIPTDDLGGTPAAVRMVA